MSGVKSDVGPWSLVPEWVLDSGVSDRAIRLYALLGRYSDKDTGKSFPLRSTLAKRLNCSESSLDRATKELEKVKALKREHRHSDVGDYTSNMYTILFLRPGGVTSEATGGVTHDAHNESQVEREKTLAAAPRDEIWDALEQIFGKVTNDNARGKRNKAVKLLKQSEALPSEIEGRARRYLGLYPDAAFTDMALANQWDNLGHIIPVIEEQAGVRAMEEREAQERKAEAEDAVPPEEAAARAKALLDHLRGNA